ncbi:MAG TPA: S41 family peptidase [Salinivirgaceae bacterium]|nr:S41 family peptidase [Salinivirgaceae bacterium]HQA76334.1 S41 family peptidase [Salinivirgaceae bacterium]
MKNRLLGIFLILQSCIYAQEYVPTYLSKNEVKADLKFLKDKLTNIHPLFLDQNFNNQWNEQYSEAYTNIPDSMTFNNCYTMFTSLMATLKDGHSNFAFPFSERVKYMNAEGVTMPFTVEIKNNKIILKECFDENYYIELVGSEILSINEIPANKILERLVNFYGDKNIAIINNNIEKYFGAYFWIVYGSFPQYKIDLLKDGGEFLVTLNAVNNQDYFTLRNKFYPQQTEEKYQLNFINSDSIAYLKIKSFADKKVLSDFLDNAFDSIKEKGFKNLIIDVRDNPGGTSDGVDTLLSYLTTERYRQYKSIGLRVSNEIKNIYENKKPELYNMVKHFEDNQLFYYDDTMLVKMPVHRQNRYNGSLFVLIDDKTFSAASTFAGVIKEYNIGKIVGYSATGGTIEYYGDFLLFKLPNTKMEFFISSKHFIQYGGADLDKGVFPSIKIEENEDIENIVKKQKHHDNL